MSSLCKLKTSGAHYVTTSNTHTHTHTHTSLKAGLQLMIPEEQLSVICRVTNHMTGQQARTSADFPAY